MTKPERGIIVTIILWWLPLGVLNLRYNFGMERIFQVSTRTTGTARTARQVSMMPIRLRLQKRTPLQVPWPILILIFPVPRLAPLVAAWLIRIPARFRVIGILLSYAVLKRSGANGDI